MPQMNVVPFNNPGNAVLLDEIRGTLSTDYQRRVPAATKAGLDATMNAMWGYAPALNQAVDALVNLIGAQQIKSISWSNPLAKYKQGLLNHGETIEEVYVGLIKATAFDMNAEYLERELFGREPNNVQSAFHKINRTEKYKISIPEVMLERAFLNANGIGQLLNDFMQSIGTSDQWDEFLQITSVFNRYYERDGMFKVRVPNISSINATQQDAKQFIRTVRSYADTLEFISTHYNARHVQQATRKSDLELILTPDGNATIDVEALAAAFNEDKAKMPFRITVLPPEYINIPGFQGALISKRFFTIGDTRMLMTQLQNPAGLYTNHWWHHHEIISASPFENAILFTSEEESTITLIDYVVTGIADPILIHLTDQQPVTVTNNAATVTRGEPYVLISNATRVTTNGAAAPVGAVILTVEGNKSLKTRITQTGVLIIGNDEQAKTITVHIESTDDNTFDRDVTLTLSGPVIEGNVGLSVDEDPGAINNTRLPGISPQGGPVGTVLSTSHGSWDTDDLTFAVKWQRDGVDISGATGVQYTVASADAGHSINSVVGASKSGMTGASATSKSVQIPSA